jgi:hypothetical protein
MPVARIKDRISELCKRQGGTTFAETVVILLGLTTVAIIVTYVFIGPSILSADKNIDCQGNPADFQASPGVFSPITELEINHDKHPASMYSTVKEANGTDNISVYKQYISE